jgi:hypothetical protein
VPLSQALRVSGSRLFVNAEGPAELRVWDPSGRTLLTRPVRAGEIVDLKDVLADRPGVYGVTLTTSSGSAHALIPIAR